MDSKVEEVEYANRVLIPRANNPSTIADILNRADARPLAQRGQCVVRRSGALAGMFGFAWGVGFRLFASRRDAATHLR